MYKNEFLEQNTKYTYDDSQHDQSFYLNTHNNKKNNFNRNENIKQENFSQNEFSQRDSLQTDNYTNSIIESLFENEKVFRTTEMKLKIQKMRREVLLSQLEQSKFYLFILLNSLEKKNSEILKSEIKKIKATLEKLKDQINIISRENDFLHNMIEFTSGQDEINN